MQNRIKNFPVCLFIGLLSVFINTETLFAAEEDSTPTKRALIVAIGEYAPDTGWGNISSNNDVVLLRETLVQHGFAEANIHELTDAQATHDGIVAAFRGKLIEPTGEGDVVVFHFSGHGQQVTDDNGDELDGYDEALVPYDAPSRLIEGYQGEKHLRDDTVNQLLHELRQKVGPTGNVIALLDSCYSGTGTRGTARVRGGAKPLDLPGGAEAKAGTEQGSGFHEPPAAATRGAAAGEDAGLATFVVFSAAQYDELAYETETEDGTPVGPLSYGITTALVRPVQVGTYRRLFEEVVWAFQQKRVPNTPLVEGDVDAEVFSGRAVFQQPFIEVAKVQGKRVTLKAGTIAGLMEDSQVEFHRAGTLEPTADSKLTEGMVVNSGRFTATVEIAGPVAEEELVKSRAFVTAYAFGDLRIGVQLMNFEQSDIKDQLTSALEQMPAVELVESDPEVIVAVESSRAPAPQVVVNVAKTGAKILGPLSATDRTWTDEITRRLQDFARNRYLRSLKLTAPDKDVRLEVVPVDLTECVDETRPGLDTCTVTELDQEQFLTAGHRLRLPLNTWFKLRVHYDGDKEIYVSILDLPDDGTIGLLWPPPRTGDRTRLSKTSSPKDLDALYRIVPPTGLEVFMLIASEEWIDFEPFVSKDVRGPKRGGEGTGPFKPLFDDAAVRQRASAYFPQGSVATAAVTLMVTE